jgi:hypothetical protein
MTKANLNNRGSNGPVEVPGKLVVRQPSHRGCAERGEEHHKGKRNGADPDSTP